MQHPGQVPAGVRRDMREDGSVALLGSHPRPLHASDRSRRPVPEEVTKDWGPAR